MKRYSFVLEDSRFSGMRVDKYLADVLNIATRSRLKNCGITIAVNGKAAKPSRQLQSGDVVEVTLSEPQAPGYSAEEIELDVLFENGRVIVVNKPQGMVVHPGAGVSSGTLVQGLLHRCGEIASGFEGDAVRPGIVHRLDRDTSGVLIAAKDPDALESLSAQFQSRSTRKVYYAVVKGRPPKRKGVIDANVARDRSNRKRFTVSRSRGKPSVTRYHVLKVYEGYSFVRLLPETGRTHQLRVHLKAEGCPILGDPVYARKDANFPDAALMLHAFSLSLTLPGEKSPAFFRSRLPRRFADVLARLEKEFGIERGSGRAAGHTG